MILPEIRSGESVGLCSISPWFKKIFQQQKKVTVFESILRR